MENYFRGDALAQSVWENKYALEGETPFDMHQRIADELGRIRNKKDPSLSKGGWASRFIGLLADFKYIIPQGSIMAILGSNIKGSLSNCFLVGQPEDSYGGIFKKDQELAQLMKRRGGVGIDISTLRPRGVPTSNAARNSTGAVSFMHRFSNTTREVAQGGRRGALMISIDIRHPDVEEFIKIKRDLTQVTGANISIKLNDDFMEAVESKSDFILKWPINRNIEKYPVEVTDLQYDVLDKVTNASGDSVYIKKVKAYKLWDEIVESAWQSAEPGLLLWDNMLKYGPDSVYPEYRPLSTNPCGEIAMGPYDACRLLVLNLYSYVDHPFTDKAKINLNRLQAHAFSLQKIADDIVDLEIEYIEKIILKIKNDPEPDLVKQTELILWNKILKVASSGRRTGCGITGLGDMLAALGIRYDSEQALDVVDEVMKRKMKGEFNATIAMAEKYGPFKGWNPNLEENEFYLKLKQRFPGLYSSMQMFGRRNVSWSTVAPTGSVSILTQTTSGIEPLFQPYYIRRKKVNPNDENSIVTFVDPNGDSWEEHAVIHPKFLTWYSICNNKSYEDSSSLLSSYTKEDLDKLFEKSPWFRSTANDINWINRLKLQAVVQKYTTHSISSTINLPNSVTKEEVGQIYFTAWKLGLKGITVYRDGCRTGVLVTEKFKQNNAFKRPKTVDCDIYLVTVKGELYNILVGLVEGKPYEVFAFVGKHFPKGSGKLIKASRQKYSLQVKDEISKDIGSAMNDDHEAITRLISGMLRHGAHIKFIVEQLNKTPGDLTNFTKAIARTLKRYIKDGEKATGSCDQCGSSKIIYQEGCRSCLDCGNSKCG